MRIKIYTFLVAITLSVLITLAVLLIRSNSSLSMPAEALKASEEFKFDGNLKARISQAKTLVPYLKNGMSKTEVLALLGKPDRVFQEEYYSSVIYDVFWSQTIDVYFDEEGKVFHFEGPGIEFLSHYDRNWAFIRLGMTKEEVLSRFYEEQKKLQGGKIWQYYNPKDPHLYNIHFDENDKVIHLEKTELALNSVQP